MYKIYHPNIGIIVKVNALVGEEKNNVEWSPMVYVDGHREGTIWINDEPYAIEEVEGMIEV